MIRFSNASDRTRMRPLKRRARAHKFTGDTSEQISAPSRWFAAIFWLALLLVPNVPTDAAATNKRAASEINLDYQMLDSIPADKLCQTAGPEVVSSTSQWNQVNAVSLANNRIRAIGASSFACVAAALRILILSNNQISHISASAFNNLGALQVLSLDNNQLESIPSIDALSPLKSLKHINLANNRIGVLPSNSFGPASSSLISLNLQGNPLDFLAPDSLQHLARLKTLTLSQTSISSGSLPLLVGLNELRFYHLDRLLGNLTFVPEDLCRTSRKLSSLVLKSNKLEQVPRFTHCQSLLQLDLSYNEIRGTLNENFTQQPNLIDLYLNHNQLEWIGERAFSGLAQLQVLELAYNKLIHIQAGAFVPVRATIRDLSIASNPHLSHLDVAGLERLASFKSYGNPRLRHLPNLPRARNLALTYAYHCCEYLSNNAGKRVATAALERQRIETSLIGDLFESLLRKFGWSELVPTLAENPSPTNSHLANLSDSILWPRIQRPAQEDTNISVQAHSNQHNTQLDAEVIDDQQQQERIRCLPEPSAFLPCEDLFDSWWLRLGIWLVFPLAFAGNILVIVVLGSVRQSSSTSALASIMWLSRSKKHIDVPRFLVINLAIADLMMAFYLGILAFVDLSTRGEFRLFAIKWQYSSGCKLAGFLGVLSSELSVFILAIITLERNYAITNAVHLNRRLSLHKAMLIMLLGYAYALTMALMPLNGINDYRKFSICLPLDTAGAGSTSAPISTTQDAQTSQIYLITLISINTLSFILLLGCYLRMYCAIRGSQAWNTNDLRIAKRMSILVLTDFLCWMPIICVAVVSLFGHQLIGTQGLKVLAIFVLPLNSVANPFLYAITTKKFKRDLDTLVRRLRAWLNLGKCLRNNNESNSDPRSKIYLSQHHLAFSQNHHRRLQKKACKSHTTVGAVKPRTHKGAGGLECCCCCCCCDKHDDRGKRQCCKHTLNNALINVNRPLITANHLVTINKTSCSVDAIVGHMVGSSLTLHKEASFQHAGASIADIPQVQIKFEQQSSNSNSSDQSNAERSAAHLASCQTVLAVCSDRGRYRLAADGHQTTRSQRLEPNIRSVSACGYRCSPDRAPQNKHQRPVSCSCEAAVGEGQTRSRSIQRLLFDPLAKAWSSVRISSMSSASFSDMITNDRSQSFSAEDERDLEVREGSLAKDQSKSTELEKSLTTDDISNMFGGSPNARHLQLRINERRMSRSCDYIISDHATGTSELTATTMSTGDDDQKFLLSASAFQAPSHLMDQPRSFRQRCTRCRSWSPALLSKLEECIYRVRSRIPGLRGGDLNSSSRESVGMRDSRNAGLRQQPGLEEKPEEHEDSGTVTTQLSRTKERVRQMPKVAHKRRRLLKQQSSANSDSFSTKTGATMLTNMSVSFDCDEDPDDQQDIPWPIEDVIDEREP